MKKLKYFITIIILILIGISASYLEIFYVFDNYITDKFYQTPKKINNNIKIIGIDEKTLTRLGPFGTWSRGITANLINIVNKEEKPFLIGLDITYIGNMDEKGDKEFAQACEKGKNVIAASNINFKSAIKKSEIEIYYNDPLNVIGIEYPYEYLRKNSKTGFTNAIYENDSYIRKSLSVINYEGNEIYSFPVEIYKEYAKKTGLDFNMPDTDKFGRFGFKYSGKPGSYEKISFIDVLDEKVDPKVFKDSIILVGAYASGMQDAYNVPIDHSKQMYGVEIHANIIQALLDNNLYMPLNPKIMAVVTGIVIAVFFIVIKKVNLLNSTLLTIGIIIIQFIIGRLLFNNGIFIGVITIPIFISFIYFYNLIQRYINEVLNKKKLLDAFKKYVAPQVVEKISKKEDFEINLGGENRHIAVLFVDIRGFTSISENLSPEQVVEILNKYLDIITKSIFKNDGTLDKFIGDAVMAIFNSPFDIDDYIYKAVLTAIDIISEISTTNEELKNLYDINIGVGIGINCGNAIVGNIGCDFRMDYTAIGDTVNTASRLEGKASKSEILISEEVYNAIKGRIKAESIGSILLRGKEKATTVYSIKL